MLLSLDNPTCEVEVLVSEETGSHHHGQAHREHCAHQAKEINELIVTTTIKVVFTLIDGG
jgi:hypothetical protein